MEEEFGAFNSEVRHFAQNVQESAKYIHAANSKNNKNKLREEENARKIELFNK